MLPDGELGERRVPRADEATEHVAGHMRNNTTQLDRQGRGRELLELNFLDELPPLPGLPGADADAAEQPLFPLPPRPLVHVKSEPEEAGQATVKVQQCEEVQSAGAVTLEELRQVFTLPRAAAARKLSISNNSLKRVCRDKGIARWPHRKLLSLDNLAVACRSDLLLDKGTSEALLRAIDEERVRMIQDPNRPVDKNLLKMRLASYKKRYAQRKKVEPRLPRCTRAAAAGAGEAQGAGMRAGIGISSDSGDDSGDDSGSDKGGETEEDEEQEQESSRRQQRPVHIGSDRRMRAPAMEGTTGIMQLAKALATGKPVPRAADAAGSSKPGSGRLLPGVGQAAAVTGSERMSIDQAAVVVTNAAMLPACNDAAGAEQRRLNAAGDCTLKQEEQQAMVLGPIHPSGSFIETNKPGPARKDVPGAGAAASRLHSPDAQARAAAASTVVQLPQAGLRRVISGVALVPATGEQHHATAVVSGGRATQPVAASLEQLLFARRSDPSGQQDLALAAGRKGTEAAHEPRSMPQLPARCMPGTDSPSTPPSPRLTMEAPLSAPLLLSDVISSGMLCPSPTPSGSAQDTQVTGRARGPMEARLGLLPSGTHITLGAASRRASPPPNMHASWDATVSRAAQQAGTSQPMVQPGAPPDGPRVDQELRQPLSSSFPGFYSTPSSYEHQPHQYPGNLASLGGFKQSPPAAVATQWDMMLGGGVGWSSSDTHAGIRSALHKHSGAHEPAPYACLLGTDQQGGDFSFLDGVPGDCLDDGPPPQLLTGTHALTGSPNAGSCGGSGAAPGCNGAVQASGPMGHLQDSRNALLATSSSVGSRHALTMAEFLTMPLAQLPHGAQQSYNLHQPNPLGPGHMPRMLHSAPQAGGLPHRLSLSPPLAPPQPAPLPKPALPPQHRLQQSGGGGQGHDFLDGGDVWHLASGGDMLEGGSAFVDTPSWPPKNVKSEPLPFVSLDSFQCGNYVGSSPLLHALHAGHHTVGHMANGGISGGAGCAPGIYSAPMAHVSMLPGLSQEMQRQGSGAGSSQNPSTSTFIAGHLAQGRARQHRSSHTSTGGPVHGPDAAHHTAVQLAHSVPMPDGVQLLPRAAAIGPSSVRAAATGHIGSVSPPLPPLDVSAAAMAQPGGFWMGVQATPLEHGPPAGGSSRTGAHEQLPPSWPPSWEQLGSVDGGSSDSKRPGGAATATAQLQAGSRGVDARGGMVGQPPLDLGLHTEQAAEPPPPLLLVSADSLGITGPEDEYDALLATMHEIMASGGHDGMHNGHQLSTLDLIMTSFDMLDPTN